MQFFAKTVRCLAFCLALCLCAPLFAQRYYSHLSPGAIDEAFALGQRKDQDTDAFLARYFHRFPTPPKGPCISSIELLTPYAQIVNHAMLNLGNENVFNVEKKYGSRVGFVQLTVRVFSTPTYTLPYDDDALWKEFEVTVSQEHSLEIKRKRLTRAYPGEDGGGFEYADMVLRLNADDVASAPIKIEVSTSDGQHVEAKFDLSRLR